MTSKNNLPDTDAEFFSAWLKKMDTDVATAFVLSGISLKKEKLLEAFDVACQIMHLRAVNEAERLKEKFGIKDEIDKLSASLDATSKTTEKDTQDFVSRIDKLIKGVLDSSKKKDSGDK